MQFMTAAELARQYRVSREEVDERLIRHGLTDDYGTPKLLASRKGLVRKFGKHGHLWDATKTAAIIFRNWHRMRDIVRTLGGRSPTEDDWKAFCTLRASVRELDKPSLIEWLSIVTATKRSLIVRLFESKTLGQVMQEALLARRW